MICSKYYQQDRNCKLITMHKLLGVLVPAALIVFLPTLALAGNNSRVNTSHDSYSSFNAHDYDRDSDDYYREHSSRDKVPPVIAHHNDITATTTSTSGVVVSYTNPTAYDANDGAVAVSCSPSSGHKFPVGNTTVRCSAQDRSGNESVTSFTITVVGPPRDHTPPGILSLHIGSNNSSTTLAYPGNVVTISFTANEQVTKPFVLVNSKQHFAAVTNTGGNSWSASYTVDSKDRAGKVIYIITLVDTSHNLYVCSSVALPFLAKCPTTDGSSVTVSQTAPPPPADTTPPDIQGYSSITVDADGADGTIVSYDMPVAVDDTDGSVAVSCTPAAGTLFPVGNTTVTCTATDAAGNTATATFVVTVNPYIAPDTTPPAISEHDDIAVDTPNSGGTTVTYDLPTAVDAVDGPVAVSCDPVSGSLFPEGDTTVTCTAEDTAGNSAATTFTVTVTVTPPPDTVPPVIDAHADVAADTSDSSGAVVTYTVPTATDDIDGSVAVSCTPASGSTFPLGPTTVTCTAQDAAGNPASTSFTVTVTFVPQPYTMASQPDESTFCDPDWRDCYTGGSAQRVIDLGQGAALGQGTLLSATIAKDPASPFASNPWLISILCYTDAAHTTTCPDWIQPNTYNSHTSYRVVEQATSTIDNKYWTAYFTNPSQEANFNGTSPVKFNPAYYYTLVINDNGWEIGAYGSATEPYWVLTGMTSAQ